MSNGSNARKALLANALFSTITGVICLLTASQISSLMFVNPADWVVQALRVLGIGLIGFATYVACVALAHRVSRRRTMEVVVADIAWVFGTAILAWLYGSIFTNAGLVVLWAIAGFVASFAACQYVAAQKLEPTR